jgi:hypothetical protein
MSLGNGYFVTDKLPLLYSAIQLCWIAIYKIGVLIVRRCNPASGEDGKYLKKNITIKFFIVITDFLSETPPNQQRVTVPGALSVPLGNGYFVTDKSPLLFFKGLIVRRCIISVV